MKGKLHEIDLGAEARARNVAMTERATQRLRGAGGDDANGGGGGLSEGGSGTERLGRDGKPLRRKRRASDDLKRDQMVEQFLHENRSTSLSFTFFFFLFFPFILFSFVMPS